MNNDEGVRSILLVRAVETHDADAVVLTAADRERASRDAMVRDDRPSDPRVKPSASARRMAMEDFVQRRAEAARAILEERHPAVGRVVRTTRGRWWLGPLLVVAAFLVGAASDFIGPARRVDILAFPLLGMLLWNVAVYVWLFAQAMMVIFGPGRSGPHPLRGLLVRMRAPAQSLADRCLPGAPAPLLAGVRAYLADWLERAAPNLSASAARTLHFAAAALALGVIAGMYVRGLGLNYIAGWDSTFLNENTVARLLQTVLKPASAITGIPLPGPAQLANMRWSSSQAGVGAAPWIHLWAVTAGLLIVVPRVVLGFKAWIAASKRRVFFPLDEDDPWLEGVLARRAGRGDTVNILPYSYGLPDEGGGMLRAALRELLGERTRVQMLAQVDYGGEDRFLESSGAIVTQLPEWLIVVVNLASTPEEEAHAALVGGLAALIAQGRVARRLIVLADAAAYRERLGEAELGETRIAERTRLWRRALDGHSLHVVDLGTGGDRKMLRGALQAALTGSRVPGTPA